jgi:hypothetical protein
MSRSPAGSQAKPWLAAVVGRGAQNLVANAMSQLRAPPRVVPHLCLDPSSLSFWLLIPCARLVANSILLFWSDEDKGLLIITTSTGFLALD